MLTVFTNSKNLEIFLFLNRYIWRGFTSIIQMKAINLFLEVGCTTEFVSETFTQIRSLYKYVVNVP